MWDTHCLIRKKNDNYPGCPNPGCPNRSLKTMIVCIAVTKVVPLRKTVSLLVSAPEQPTQMHVIAFMNIISTIPTAVQAGPSLADPW